MSGWERAPTASTPTSQALSRCKAFKRHNQCTRTSCAMSRRLSPHFFSRVDLSCIASLLSSISELHLVDGRHLTAYSIRFGSPVVARSLVSKVCHQTGGRSYSIAYRVGPQHTFPAFLLDGLVAYFSLLSPPPNAPHQPVPASSLVLAGESAGAALCLAIVKFLLGLRHSLAKRNRPLYIRFNGRDVPLDLPAGLALHSIFAETLVKLPSTVKFYYPDFISGGPPYFQPDYPADSTWPTNPPRAEVYVDASALLHPLLCLCTVTDWRGCPPMFVSFGEERLADSNLIIAQQAARQGVVVRLLQYEYFS